MSLQPQLVKIPDMCVNMSLCIHIFFELFFFLINLFIYLFLAELGLRCCTQAFSSCGERGLIFIAVHGLLIEMASLAVEHRL